MNKYSKYSNEFVEISSIYIKNNEVIKARPNVDTSVEGVLLATENKNRVIVEYGNELFCYFEDYTPIDNIIERLKNRGLDVKDFIIKM